MKTNKNIEAIKKKIIPILKKNKVVRAGIFGSYARGEQKKNSDIDVLIQPPKGIGLGFVGIKLELEDELGRKVDLLTYKSLHPLLTEEPLTGTELPLLSPNLNLGDMYYSLTGADPTTLATRACLKPINIGLATATDEYVPKIMPAIRA